jgi:hypothetical protein
MSLKCFDLHGEASENCELHDLVIHFCAQCPDPDTVKQVRYKDSSP